MDKLGDLAALNQISFRLLAGTTPVTSRLKMTHSGFTQHEKRTKRALIIVHCLQTSLSSFNANIIFGQHYRITILSIISKDSIKNK